MEIEHELDFRLAAQEPGNALAARRLYTLLIHSCKGAALDRVINAGPGEGLLAWKDMVERFEPRQRTRQAGLLQALMAWSFQGDPLERLEAWEREVARWEPADSDNPADEPAVDTAAANAASGLPAADGADESADDDAAMECGAPPQGGFSSCEGCAFACIPSLGICARCSREGKFMSAVDVPLMYPPAIWCPAAAAQGQPAPPVPRPQPQG